MRAMYSRWQDDLRAAVPTARSLTADRQSLMFLSNEADVLREYELRGHIHRP